MLKLLRRLFAILTLASLLIWSGVTVQLVRAQYQDVPPLGWPIDYSSCVDKWSAHVALPDKAAQMANRCGDYYALIGDRSAPLLKRLQQQVQGRLSENIINAYLALNVPLQEGQVVTPPMILQALGTQRLMQLVYQTIAQAAEPPSAARRLHARCVLEETQRAERAFHPDYVVQLCMRAR